MADCNQNLDPLYANNFALTIESEKFDVTEYFLTTCNLPSLTFNNPETSFRQYEAFNAAGMLRYSPFTITFNVDQEMKNYLEIYHWMIRLQNENALEEHDAVLHIYSGRGELIKEIRFKGLKPSSMTELQFTVTDNNDAPLPCSVDFSYDGFTFEK